MLCANKKLIMLIDRLVAVDLLDAFCLDHKVRLDDGLYNSVN